MVPLISIIFGLPMIILSAQMVVGMRTPIFPKFIRNQTIQREVLVQGIGKCVRGLETIERYIKPRFALLSYPILDRVHGLMALTMAILVTLPIPLFNILPSLALAILAVGLLQRDGLLISAAYAVAAWCLILFKSLGHLAHHLTTASS